MADRLSTAAVRRCPTRLGTCDRAAVIQLHRAVAPLVAFAATGLLVGCSNDTGAAPATSSTTVATSTPVVTPTPSATTVETPTSVATADAPLPEQDDLSRTFTVDGASAFAGYVTRILNYARETGDPTLLRSISAEGCGGCISYANEIDEYRARGYVSTGTLLEFRGTDILSWDPEAGEIDMNVILNRPPHRLLDSTGAVLEDVPADRELQAYLWLKWTDQHWVVWEVE